MTFGMDTNGRVRPLPVIFSGMLLVGGMAYLGYEARDALKAGQTAPAAIERLEAGQAQLVAKIDVILATLSGMPAQAERINALDDRANDRWQWTNEEMRRLRAADIAAENDLRHLQQTIRKHESRPHTAQ